MPIKRSLGEGSEILRAGRSWCTAKSWEISLFTFVYPPFLQHREPRTLFARHTYDPGYTVSSCPTPLPVSKQDHLLQGQKADMGLACLTLLGVGETTASWTDIAHDHGDWPNFTGTWGIRFPPGFSIACISRALGPSAPQSLLSQILSWATVCPTSRPERTPYSGKQTDTQTNRLLKHKFYSFH